MTISTYDIGNQVDMVGVFTTSAGATVDPSTVLCLFQNPAGTETTYTYGVDAELTKLSTGRYQLRLTTAAAGNHFYRFKGTAGVICAGESWFRVRASEFASP